MSRVSEVKKLVSVSATSTPVTGTRERAVETVRVDKNDKKSKSEYPNLAQIPCIRYFITFWKKSVSMSALVDSSSEVNAIHPTLARELGLPIGQMDVGVQKIDSTMLDTFGMVVIAFSVIDKANQVRLFEETFLVANVSSEIVFEMLFLTLSGTNVNSLGQELRWRTYTTKEAFPTTRRVKLVGKKEFTAVAFDPEHETFAVYVASLNSTPLNIRPQISGLIAKETPTKVSTKYLDFANIFSPDLAYKLPKHTRINNHAIKLVNSYQQPLYRPIYSLKPVELETLKAYIETNLANRFITLSKSSAGAPILFDRKLDGCL